MRSRFPLLLIAFSPLALAGHGQNFVFREEPARLPPDTSPLGTSTTDVDLVDVDGDGDLDLFITEGTDSLAGRPNRLLINDGQGVFADQSAQRLPPLVANSTKTDFGDVDGDGDLDAIVADVGPEQLLINDGHGVFTDASATQLPPPIPIFADISSDAHFVDVDRDGDLDIAVSNENPFDPSPGSGAQNRLFINDGSGAFSDQTTARLPTGVDQTAAILSGDIDGDGDSDLVVLNRGQDKVFINDGTGVFSDQTAARIPASNDTSRAGELADLDGDGDLDLIVANSRNEPVTLYFNQGGVFTAHPFGEVPFPDETDAGLALVDLDGDGDLDVYISNAGAFSSGHGFAGGQDRYFTNNGRGHFKERTDKHFPAEADPTTDAAFGDVDGDGDLDLVVGNTGAVEKLYLQYDRGELFR